MKTIVRKVENPNIYINELGIEYKLEMAVYKEPIEHAAFYEREQGRVQLKVHGLIIIKTMMLNQKEDVEEFDMGHVSVTLNGPNCLASELSRMNEPSISKLREYVLSESVQWREGIQMHANRAYRKELGVMKQNIALVAKPRRKTVNPYIANKGVLA